MRSGETTAAAEVARMMEAEPQFKCRACGTVWPARQTRDYMGKPHMRTCSDAFCGATCDPVKAENKEGKE